MIMYGNKELTDNEIDEMIERKKDRTYWYDPPVIINLKEEMEFWDELLKEQETTSEKK